MMDDISRTSEVLNCLKIREISKEIPDLENLWNQDLLDEIVIPEDLKQCIANERYLVSQLKNAVEACRCWTNDTHDSKDFWGIFQEKNISLRTILVLLCHLLDSADRHLSKIYQREAATLASTLYFIILQIPGSGAFNILHPIIFEKALGTFKLLPSNVPGKRKRNESQTSSSQGSSKRQHRARNQRPEIQIEIGEDIEEDSDDDDAALTVLTANEIHKLKGCLMSTLKELLSLLDNYSLKQSEHCCHLVLQVLTELTKAEPNIQIVKFAYDWATTSLTELAFVGLTRLCTPAHGDVQSSIRSVFKHLMPGILMLIGENEGVATSAIPKEVQNIKDNAVAYVCYIIGHLGETSHVSARVLLQHLCVKVPDRSEYRPRIAAAVTTILAALPSSFNSSFMQWLYKYSKNTKSGFRVFALEIVSVMLENSQKSTQQGDSACDSQQLAYNQVLLCMLLGRCSDKAPTVRAKALSCFAVFTSSGDPTVLHVLKSLFNQPGQPPVQCTPANLQRTEKPPNEANDTTEQIENEGGDSSARKDSVAEAVDNVLSSKNGATPGNLFGGSPAMLLELTSDTSTQDGQSMIAMLRSRVGDLKVGVRKAAIQALSNLIALDGMFVNECDVEVLYNHCMDPALSVRKQALNSVTNLLLLRPENPAQQRMWLNAVLPMVMDKEVTAQERCLQMLEEVILQKITHLKKSTEDSHTLAWSLLSFVAGSEGFAVRKYFQKACSLWARQKKLNKKIVESLITHIDTQNREAAWMVLSYTSMCTTDLNPDFVIESWNRYTLPGEDVSLQTLCCVLTVLGVMADRLDRTIIDTLTDDLSLRLQRFDSPTELIVDYIRTLCKLCSAQNRDVEDFQKAIAVVCTDILKSCDHYLKAVVLTENQSQSTWDEDTLVKHLFTLGEVAQLCPNNVSARLFMLVQSLLAGPGNLGISGEKNLLSSQIPSQPSQTQAPISQFCGSKMSDKVRAYAFITIGKLCLQHESLAKQTIAAIARELETSTDTATRNNVVVVMCDLCKRYPNLVYHYIPNIASCLKDESPLIRRQTLTLLTHLLLEDFIKWRGCLFFRFIMTMVDEVQEIQDFAQLCFKQLLLPRHPNLLFQHFVECVYHFNSYEKHNVYNRFPQTDKEKQMFSLRGQMNQEKRLKLYAFMLENMKDEHRFQIVAKLTQEVIAAVVDDILPFDRHTCILLQDTLTIMSSKEIKLSSLRNKSVDEPADEMEMAGAVMQQAKAKLITQVVKKNVIENIVPIIIALKHQLEKHRSPVLKYLMMYLKELMKDYRNEIKDIMSADHQLASEIEFDLRKFEEQQEEMKKLEEELRQQTIDVEGGTPAGSPRTGSIASPHSGPDANSPVQNPSKPVTPQSLRRLQDQAPLTPSMVVNLSPRVVLQPLNLINTQVDLSIPPRTPLPNSLAVMAIVNSAKKMLASVGKSKQNAINDDIHMETGSCASPPLNGGRQSRQADVIGLAVGNRVDNPGGSRNSGSRMEQIGVTGTQEKSAAKTRENEAIRSTENRPRRINVVSDRNKLKTPRQDNKKKPNRAISTPDTTIGSITFMEPMDVSAIPSSPIPTSMPIRLYADVDPKQVTGMQSWTPQLESDTNDNRPNDILVMFSPEQPAPKPRKWNVRSSSESTSKKNISRSDAPDDPLCFDDLSQPRQTRSQTSSNQPVRRKSSRSHKK